MPDEQKTIKSALEEAAPQIGRFEAMLLLGFTIEKTREFLLAHDDETLSNEDLMKFQMLVTLRLSGMPIPYITGRQEFYGRWFEVNDAVLIPRPDTEVLIEQALEIAPACADILDLGTGSGCIAVTLALELPGAKITATDSSETALATAERNAKKLGADIAFRRGFWWDGVPESALYDLIVSNPPYIRPDDEHLAKLGCEPLGALTDGIDGLQCLRDISAGAMAHLKASGWLMLEHGYDQAKDVQAMLHQAGFAAVHTKKDYGGNDRITMGRKA